jgi:hypothetical protein
MVGDLEQILYSWPSSTCHNYMSSGMMTWKYVPEQWLCIECHHHHKQLRIATLFYLSKRWNILNMNETDILIGSNKYFLMWFSVLLFHGAFKHCIHTSFTSQNIFCTHDMCSTLNSQLLTLKWYAGSPAWLVLLLVTHCYDIESQHPSSTHNMDCACGRSWFSWVLFHAQLSSDNCWFAGSCARCFSAHY